MAAVTILIIPGWLLPGALLSRNSAKGGRKASTHSPTAIRPGRLSYALRAGFHAAGYPLQTIGPVGQGLIEVYPHPALIEFAASPERLPYKFEKRGKYWPQLDGQQRREKILAEWRRIGVLLEDKLAGAAAVVAAFDGEDAPGRLWKAQEDQIDAMICAAVAVHALDGQARPFGDDRSAIWIPVPRRSG